MKLCFVPRSFGPALSLVALCGLVSACHDDAVVLEPGGDGGGDGGTGGTGNNAGDSGSGNGTSGNGGAWAAPPLRDLLETGNTELANSALELMGSAAVGAEG